MTPAVESLLLLLASVVIVLGVFAVFLLLIEGVEWVLRRWRK